MSHTRGGLFLTAVLAAFIVAAFPWSVDAGQGPRSIPSKPGNPGMPGLLAQIEALNAEITGLQAQLIALQGQLSAKDSAIAALEGQVSSLEDQLAVKNAEIAALQEQLSAQQVRGFAYLGADLMFLSGFYERQSIGGSFQLPPGVTTVFVEVWGAGGGSGARGPDGVGGGPGGGGGYSSGTVTTMHGSLSYQVGLGGSGGFWHNILWAPGRGGAGGDSGIGHIVAGGGGGGHEGVDPDYCSREGGAGGSGDSPGLNGQDENNQSLPGVSVFVGVSVFGVPNTNKIFGPGTGGWPAAPICQGGAAAAENGKAGLPGLIRISW